jgi:hypothetical protein
MQLRNTQCLFAQGIPPGGDDKCAGLDRQTVLNIYTEALSLLSSSPQKHTQIAAECTRKVRVVLGIVSADPDDTVFTRTGQLLKPLEPQYANPRLEAGEDEYGNLAQWRLNAWRNDGWPEKYPAYAVKKEKKKGERLVDHMGKQSLSDGIMLTRVMQDDEMWDDDGMGYSGEMRVVKKRKGRVTYDNEDKGEGRASTT